MADPPTDQQARWRKRRREIVLLLSSRNDERYEPAGMRLEAQRGEVADKKVLCPNGCEDGWKVDRFQRKRPCERCGGGESVSEDVVDGLVVTVAVPYSGRGWIEVDSHTDHEVGSERTGVTIARTRIVPCDRCGGEGAHPFDPDGRCRVCRGIGRREVAAEPFRAAHAATPRRGGAYKGGEEEGPVSVRGLRLFVEDDWRKLGSYEVLDIALTRLPGTIFRHLLAEVYMDGPRNAAERGLGPFELGELRASQLGPVKRKYLEKGLRMLDRLLPRRLRVPRAVIEAAERRR